MENTNTIQFPNDRAEWFYAVGENYRGPFLAAEIYQKLQNREVSWIDYIYRESDGKWVRVADHPVFQALQPAPPKPKPMVTTPPPPPAKKVPETKWFLFQNETQSGPYSTQEVIRLQTAGQVAAQAFVWQEQFNEWKPIGDVAELKAVAGTPVQMQAAPAPAKPSEKRTAPRKPLTAQVYATNLKDLVTGVCRDVSIGGMQVLTDQLPGAVGTTIRLNVAPLADSGVTPFVAEGTIVRILEDRRGFSFRFVKLSDEARSAIEKYIERSAS